MLLGKKIGQKYQNMTILLKKDWKIIRITKKILTIFVQRLQLYVTVLKKDTSYQAEILLAIKKYWE